MTFHLVKSFGIPKLCINIGTEETFSMKSWPGMKFKKNKQPKKFNNILIHDLLTVIK